MATPSKRSFLFVNGGSLQCLSAIGPEWRCYYNGGIENKHLVFSAFRQLGLSGRVICGTGFGTRLTGLQCLSAIGPEWPPPLTRENCNDWVLGHQCLSAIGPEWPRAALPSVVPTGPPSSVPFGDWARVAATLTTTGTSRHSGCHQCLSAIGPEWPGRIVVQSRSETLCHQCLSAIGPEWPTPICRFYPNTLGTSSVPFGDWA